MYTIKPIVFVEFLLEVLLFVAERIVPGVLPGFYPSLSERVIPGLSTLEFLQGFPKKFFTNFLQEFLPGFVPKGFPVLFPEFPCNFVTKKFSKLSSIVFPGFSRDFYMSFSQDIS